MPATALALVQPMAESFPRSFRIPLKTLATMQAIEAVIRKLPGMTTDARRSLTDTLLSTVDLAAVQARHVAENYDVDFDALVADEIAKLSAEE